MAAPIRTVPLLLALLAAPGALAQEAPQEELVERVVVRNRLYTNTGRLELSPTVGLTILNRLTNHYNFNLGAAFNVSETLGFEARGGWAVASLTGLARDLRDTLARSDPSAREDVVVPDMRDLWKMTGNLSLGVRWMPIYGKVNLLGDVPVHFNAYLWAGPGVGVFERESIVYCRAVTVEAGQRVCSTPRVDRRPVGLLGSGAAGLRFFTHKGGALRLEVRDYVFPDSYLVDIDRRIAEAGGETGTAAPSPGLSHLVMADVGYIFIF